ncbi:MAG: PD-(D/E)XK nuclease family protein [Sphaerochaetaceae bacterium]
MNCQKREYVFHALDSGDVCVFPSEVSARSYLVDYAIHSKNGAILSSQGISSDTFLQLFHPYHEPKELSNDMIRQLFVQNAIKGGLSLSYFLKGRFEESTVRISKYLAKILPQFKDLCSSPVFGKLEAPLRSDVQHLYDAYRLFLADRHLFEPAYEELVIPQDHGRYRILFSDTQLGFSRLYHRLGSPAWIIPCPTEEVPEEPVIHRYENYVQEIRDTLRLIRELLDEGVPSRDIAISVAKSETMVERLRDEAVLYDVPLILRFGQNPFSHCAGRFFNLLSVVYSQQFSLDSMKALLLERGIPWKDSALQSRLIASAVDLFIDQGSLSLDKRDAWQRNLWKDTEAEAWYTSFKRLVIQLNTTSTIAELQKVFHAFQRSFLAENLWVGFEGEDLYRFCLHKLDELDDCLKSAGIDSYPKVYSLFLSFLGNQQYVSQQIQARGINVYRWTDSSALYVPHHFVLSLDYDSTRCIDTPLSCLPETVEKLLREEEDLTEATLKAISMDKARLSYHQSDYQSEGVCPSFFRKEEVVTKFLPDCYEEEKLLWSQGKADLRGNRFQQRCYQKALSSSLADTSSHLDFTKDPVPKEFLQVLYREEGRISLSSTALDTFTACPFKWMSQYVLMVKEAEYSVDLVDNRAIGEVLHSAYEAFFREIGIFDPHQREYYRERLLSCFDDALEAKYGTDGPNPSVHQWLVSNFREQSTLILQEEEMYFPHIPSVGFEEWLSYQEDQIVFSGKIDRILKLADNSYCVIDYKKGEPPMKKADKGFLSIQLPFYNRLIEHAKGGRADSAGYYSVSSGKYYLIWDKENTAYRDAGDQVFQQCLERFVSHLDSGEFPATVSSKGCEGCLWRPTCRKRFATK